VKATYAADKVTLPDVIPVTVYIQFDIGRKRNGLIATMDPPDVYKVRFDVIGKSAHSGTTFHVDCVRAIIDRDRPIKDSVPHLNNGDIGQIIPMMARYIGRVWNLTARGLTTDKFDMGYEIPRTRRLERKLTETGG